MPTPKRMEKLAASVGGKAPGERPFGPQDEMPDEYWQAVLNDTYVGNRPLGHPPTTFVHDLVGRLRCRKCAKAGRRPSATLLQLTQRPRNVAPED